MTEKNLGVMTFNVRYDTAEDGANAWPHRKELVARVFAEHQIDLAGLQEVRANQLHDLETLLPDYGWIGVGRDDGQAGGEFVPIFYDRRKFEVEKQGVFWLSETPEVVGSKGWDAALPRIATWGVFCNRTTLQRVFFINTHFDYQGALVKDHSARLLIERIVRLHEGLPVILTGDFNSTPDSSAVAMLTGDPAFKLADAKNLSLDPHVGGGQSANGFNSPGSALIIDYIFVGPGVRVQTHGYYPTIKDGVFVSDHWPVVSRVSLGTMEANRAGGQV